jgi:hypothetical protein
MGEISQRSREAIERMSPREIKELLEFMDKLENAGKLRLAYIITCQSGTLLKQYFRDGDTNHLRIILRMWFPGIMEWIERRRCGIVLGDNGGKV